MLSNQDMMVTKDYSLSRIHIPTTSPEDWKQFLVEPEKQWKSRSFPRKVEQVFKQSGLQLFQDIELGIAIPDLPSFAFPCNVNPLILFISYEGEVMPMIV